MSHHLFFVMSLSGSVVILLYELTYPIARRYFPHSWRKNILCLSLFFYLVPIALLKKVKIIVTWVKIVGPSKSEDFRIDPRYTINVQDNQLFLGSGVVIVYIFAFIIAIIAFTVIIKQLKRYGAVYRTYLLTSFHVTPPPQLERMLQQAKEELQIKKSVKLICSRLCDAPMTIGVFKPAIVFPASGDFNLKSDDNELILKHELLHIKNKDLLLKFLALTAIAAHWYNPICYLLYHELCVMSEMSCDEGVMQGANDCQRQRYSHLILDLAAASGSRNKRFAVGLVNNDAAALERRILEMKKTRKTTKPILSCILMVLICIMGVVTAFAYEAPKKQMLHDFSSESTRVFSVSNGMEDVEEFTFDHFFTDENGHVTPLHNRPQKSSCPHSYVGGTTTDHAKKSNGGCTVIVRSAKKCTICDLIVEGEVIKETKYTVCPH